MAFIEVRDVTKTYKMGEVEIKAVDEIGFGIDKGEFVVIVGPSGAGKTTILNILGGMDTATSGTIYVDNVDITKFNENELTKYRRNGRKQIAGVKGAEISHFFFLHFSRKYAMIPLTFF